MKNTKKWIALLMSGTLLLGGCSGVSEPQSSNDNLITETNVSTEESNETANASESDRNESISTEETSTEAVTTESTSTDATDSTEETQVSESTDESVKKAAPVISISLDKKEWFLEEDNTKRLLEVTYSIVEVENDGFDALKETLAEDFSGVNEENYETMIEDAKADYDSRNEEDKDYFYGYTSVEKAELARSDSAVVSFRMFYNDYIGVIATKVIPVQLGSEDANDFVSGFQLGLLIALLITCLANLVKYNKALKDEKLLKQLYYKEHDERECYINQQVGKSSMTILTVVMVIATIIAGYFNFTVFLTMIGVTFLQLVIQLLLKWYYTNCSSDNTAEEE